MRLCAPPAARRSARLPGSLFPLLAAALLVPLGLTGQSEGDAELMDVEVATVGVDLHTGATLALLHADWREVLPIWIGEVEAGAIADALRGQRPPRPMTHDLLASVLEELGGTLEEVIVHDLQENIYFGTLRIRTSDGLKEVDSRPSDALALAVRTGARVRAARSLVDGAPDAEFLSVHGERSIVRIRGMTVSSVMEEDRERFELPSNPDGLIVLHADEATASRGVRRGDLIVEVEGEPMDRPSRFLEVVAGVSRTSRLEVKVIRDGEEREVEVPPRRAPGRIGP
jgi:uncharacterized protein